MKIAIHGKVFPESTIQVIEHTINLLKAKKHECFLSNDFFDKVSQHDVNLEGIGTYLPEDSFDTFEFIISIGGDGTLLETITHVGRSNTPILGVNTGRLGFLATTNREAIAEALECIENNNFDIDSRMLLRVETSGATLFEDMNFGLNEVAVLKQDTSSMITVHTYIDGDFLNSYWADGLIISTPTGSTGYSLSCGGPVVMPHSNNLILTPVSPHNLNVRPLVVSDSCSISLEIESRSGYYMASLDSRSSVMETGVKLKIKKEHFQANLIKFDGYSFVNTLRKKLNWGLDVRN